MPLLTVPLTISSPSHFAFRSKQWWRSSNGNRETAIIAGTLPGSKCDGERRRRYRRTGKSIVCHRPASYAIPLPLEGSGTDFLGCVGNRL